MIPLSPRLLSCAAMVTGDVVCDIGTDHAYLPAYLVKSGRCRRVIATDIKDGPLASARGTLKRFGIQQEVQLVLSDGFDKVQPKGVTDVVIAGMGGETIRDILGKKSAEFLRKSQINLILQPMSKAEILRTWLAENGFEIIKEVAVKDTHVYSVIQAQFTGEIRTLTGAEPYVGKLRRSDRLTRIYLSAVLDRMHTKAHGLEDAGHTEESAEVRKTIAAISEWMEGVK